MVTVTAKMPQTSVTVQICRAEQTSSVAKMAIVFCGNGSVMVEETVKTLRTNKVMYFIDKKNPKKSPVFSGG